MAFGSFETRSTSTTMNEINMVPLIDVMLVLLVIFIITAPLLSHSIQINVPQVTAQAVDQKPEVIDIAIDENGSVFWNEQAINTTDLAVNFSQQAKQDPQPEVRLRADEVTKYGVLAEVMGAAKKAGIKRIGFITRPAPENP